MQQDVHYREYPMGCAGRVLDTAWVVVWPVLFGTIAGVLLLICGLAVLEQTTAFTPDVRSDGLRALGFSSLAILPLWFLGGLVSATRSLVYARTLRRYRTDPSCRRVPPTPAQMDVARAGDGKEDTQPFLIVWSFGLSLLIIGVVPAALGLVRLGSDGVGLLLVGGTAAVAAGTALILLARFMRRQLAAMRVSWGHNPSRAHHGVAASRPVPLPDRYRTLGVLHRAATYVGYVAVGSLTLAIILLGEDPDTGAPGLIEDPGIVAVSWTAGSLAVAILCLATALALGIVRHSMVLAVLEREAVKDEEFGTATRPDPKITSLVLTGGGPARRAVQLLSAAAAALLVIVGPAVTVVEDGTGTEWGGSPVLVGVAVGMLVVALVSDLLTSPRDRERRNRLLRTWPQAL